MPPIMWVGLWNQKMMSQAGTGARSINVNDIIMPMLMLQWLRS